MKEIGGYFELENFFGEYFHKHAIMLNTAKSCLSYLLKIKNIKKIHLPYFLCNEVFELCRKSNTAINYYNIDNNFLPVNIKSLSQEDYVYIVNYFGVFDEIQLKMLQSIYARIIVDNVHAFFQMPLQGVDTLYSCRKFFGVPDGAYLYTNAKEIIQIPIDKSRKRLNHLVGRLENNASKFYSTYKRNEKVLGLSEIKEMSLLTKNILRAVNYKKVENIRNFNYSLLHQGLAHKNRLQIRTQNGPFAYPFYCENGFLIRKELAKKKIYIPLLWPNVLENMPKHSIEYQFAASILPIPIDQRYNSEDMNTILDSLSKFF